MQPNGSREPEIGVHKNVCLAFRFRIHKQLRRSTKDYNHCIYVSFTIAAIHIIVYIFRNPQFTDENILSMFLFC